MGSDNKAPDGLPIPPPEFQTHVSGNPNANISEYFITGRHCASAIRDVLTTNGIEIDSFQNILDFGCGCARTVRHFKSFRGKLYGTDISADLINWCKSNIPFTEFGVNKANPPLAYNDEHFDLVYAFSVFTHLSEQGQLLWINELSRIVRPGGHAIITTHGEDHARVLNEEELEGFRSKKMYVRAEDHAGIPATYGRCAAFHLPEYVKEKLANENGFDVVDFVPGNPHQDLYLFKKR